MHKLKLILLGFTFLPLFSIAKAVVGLNVGNIAPEIALKNQNDSVIKLSSLRGKVVLIDFWASWCGPCRLENPNLVKAYAKYKDAQFKNGNGFTIYSVALERPDAKAVWLSAIKTDNLSWPYHVTDYKWWKSEAALKYQVQSIPANFLIDENGVILAKNLRGEQLDKALDALLPIPKAPEEPPTLVPAAGDENPPAEKPKHNEKMKNTARSLDEKRRNIGAHC